MPGLTDIPPSIYCKQCGYDLRASQQRCPECGRPFDPSDPKTFFIHRHGRLIHWLATPVGWPLVILALAAAVGVLIVSRWKPTTFAPSAIDLIYYLRPSTLLHRTHLVTGRDYLFTLSMLAAIAAAAWWGMRGVVGMVVRRRMGLGRPEEPVHVGRRHALMGMALFLISAGAALGWPYRLAQQWIARRMAKGNLLPWNATPLAPPPTNLSTDQTAATLRAAIIEMPQAVQRMTGLQLLIEDYPALALPILSEAVSLESDTQARVLELRLIGLHRDLGTINLLRGFLTHADSPTRAAAADAVGFVHAPAFTVPLGEPPGWPWNEPFATTGTIQIELWQFLKLYAVNPPTWPTILPMDVKPMEADVREALEKMMLTGPTSIEHEAAALQTFMGFLDPRAAEADAAMLNGPSASSRLLVCRYRRPRRPTRPC